MDEPTKICFADDKEHYRKMIISDLSEYNIVCIGEAGNGKELLKQLQHASPDVILLDLEMPVMDGNETMNRIMHAHPTARILVISMHYEGELVDDYIQRGAAGYLSKDMICGNIELLADTIKKISSGKTIKYKIPHVQKTFSRRQIEMIPLICDELTNQEIANQLGIQRRGVEKQRQKIYEKTNCSGSTSFLKYAFKRGLDLLGKKGENPAAGEC